MDSVIVASAQAWVEPETTVWKIVLSPLVWVAVLCAWWFVYKLNETQSPRMFRKFDAKLNRVGDLIAEGTDKPSGEELALRRDLEAAGYRMVKQGSNLVVPGEYGREGVSSLGPDMIIYSYRDKPCKIIVEYDGAPFHGFKNPGQADLDVICRDADRNQRFARAGYTVVRVRAGSNFFATTPDVHGNLRPDYWSRITPENDIVLPRGYNSRDRSAVIRTINAAQYFPASKWQPVVDQLFPYVEQRRARDKALRSAGISPQQYGG